MKSSTILAILALIVAGAWFFPEPAIERPPGVLVAEEPEQRDIARPDPWEHRGFRVTPLAGFSAAARVLLKERYWLGREAALSPVDLTLGWRLMSDNTVLDQLTIFHGRRKFWWRPKTRNPPAGADDINAHCANMHMIPAREEVARALLDLRRGSIVRFSGYLVLVEAPDGWRWRSSLSRTDTGDGACELVWVERVAAER